jgi:2-hydroxy-3-oxopropionate reductase
MSAKQHIGFVGLGAMGVGMAANVQKAGYPLSVLGNSRREPVERLVKLGATEVTSARELGETCDVVVLCVTTSDIVESLISGDQGLLSGDHRSLLVIDCGTSRPDSTLALGKTLSSAGCSLMDVPLGRSAAAAEAGTLNMMAGGSEEDFERAKPLLETMSENLFHLGPLGTGHKIKLLNNAYSMSVAALSAEIVSVASRSGVDLGLLRDVMAAGPNRSDFFDWMMAAAVESDETKLDFALKNGLKDVGYFNEFSASAGATTTMPQAAEKILKSAVDKGEGDSPIPALVRLVKASS